MKTQLKRARPSWSQLIAICLIAVSVAVFATGLFLKKQYSASLNRLRGDYSKLDEIRALVDTYYVGEYDDEELMDMLARGFLAGIGDKWAYYTDAENLQALNNDNEGVYVGIGVTISVDEDGLLTVVEVYKDSPAEKAGIYVLDKIYSVEGELVSVLGQDGAAAKMKGEPGTIVNIVIRRDGILYPFQVERQILEKVSVTSELIEEKIGYIRISEFTTVAANQFIHKLDTLQTLGMQALILDVRNNGGGSLDTLVTILDQIMPEGVVFIERNKAGQETLLRVDDRFNPVPLVVLANENSYSAAEYLAAVLQEQERATFIGAPTTGKGEGQVTFILRDKSAITFSVIEYFTPNGVDIGEQGGISPDIPVEMSYERTRLIGAQPYTEDTQIMAAVNYIRENVMQ